MDLGSLQAGRDGAPVRILEVGVGTALRVNALYSRLPDGLLVEYWGIDLALGLLVTAKSRRDADLVHGKRLRLLMSRSDALPFPDGGFDRAWSVGGLSRLGEPAAALTELGRVVRSGAPIAIIEPRASSRIGRLFDAVEAPPALPPTLRLQSEANLGSAFALQVLRRV
jgi:ubiquinone/menaquinone biosynthesis C-methylase UbiE